MSNTFWQGANTLCVALGYGPGGRLMKET